MDAAYIFFRLAVLVERRRLRAPTFPPPPRFGEPLLTPPPRKKPDKNNVDCHFLSDVDFHCSWGPGVRATQVRPLLLIYKHLIT